MRNWKKSILFLIRFLGVHVTATKKKVQITQKSFTLLDICDIHIQWIGMHIKRLAEGENRSVRMCITFADRRGSHDQGYDIGG